MRFLPSGVTPRRLAVSTRCALLATVCLTVLPYGVAQAASPKSPLLRTGKLAATSCQEPPIIDRGVPLMREYLTAAVKCLNTSWSAHFARAGLRFRKPVVRFYEEPERRVCGVRWPANAAAFYCTERATLVFPLTGHWIEGRTDLYPLKVAAHEYGHHLQSLTGVRDDYEARVRSDRSHQPELGRRYELQADCLSGVFLGSVRGSLPRTEQDWEALSGALRASGDDGRRTHGTGANRLHWFKRGYRALSPAACDTWAATPSRVS
ncbi:MULTISPECIES: neutral zinc metallopeptidase [unclassified Streptosporangium]|uniref:neutral zinc metallopeptidase n=1 Tax=unclassified Streptosporangium TaxID=2632669 RepID=UPI002E2D56C2|nr:MULTISPECIES: neutral zinc metallopeptidase [unclassified Streptosporangium]